MHNDKGKACETSPYPACYTLNITMKKGDAPFCLNSRRWLDFCFFGSPKSCPYKGDQGNVDCIYERCGYFENRKVSKRYKRNRKILLSLYKA